LIAYKARAAAARLLSQALRDQKMVKLFNVELRFKLLKIIQNLDLIIVRFQIKFGIQKEVVSQTELTGLVSIKRYKY
jgi:hypothetical protein